MSQTTKQTDILIVINELWVGGGAEKTASLLANHLTAIGQTVQVIALYDGDTTHTITGGIVVLGRAPRSKLHKLIVIPRNIWRIGQLIRHHRSQTVVTFLEEASFLTILAITLFRLKTRVIVSVRNNISALNVMYRYASRYLYRRAQKVVAVTETISTELVTRYNLPQSETIYNAIDLAQANQAAVQPLPTHLQWLESESHLCVAIGRLHPQKGYQHMIAAFAQVVAEVPQAKLLIIGSGADQPALEAQIAQLLLSDAVHLLGHQANVYQFLTRARVYVMTSLYEGMPNTMLEACVLGVPVVSTDCISGPREILAPDVSLDEQLTYPYQTPCGVLVPVATDNPTETETMIAAQILKRVRRERTHTPECQATITRRFAPATILKQWEAAVTDSTHQLAQD